MINDVKQNELISDDTDLLSLMLSENKDCPAIYQPGPYWALKTKAAVKELGKFGLSSFRGYENNTITSFGDNAAIDVRYAYSSGIRYLLGRLYRDIYPFSSLFNSQVDLTKSYFDQLVKLRTEHYKSSQRVQDLIGRYRFPTNNCKGGCMSFGIFDGMKISHHYLQAIDTIDVIRENVDLDCIRSYFEIGGGFGTNTHLLIENYPNIRKIVYLDIPPNLYVGTQYLKSFYGSKVKSFKDTHKLERIRFQSNEELEIYCIAPKQIEQLECSIDFTHNAHSFVEMPVKVVCNYAKHIERLMAVNSGLIALVSYDRFDLSSTFDPDNLPGYFSSSFAKIERNTIVPGRSNYYYISN